MFRLKFYTTMFAIFISFLKTFKQTTRLPASKGICAESLPRAFFTSSSFRASGLIAAFAFFICLVVVQTANAATFTVTTTADGINVPGSLRNALNLANAASTNDTINFAIPAVSCPAGVCTITLSSGELKVKSRAQLSGTLTITNSTGASNLVISGNNVTRVFFVDVEGNLTLNGVTITNGFKSSDGGGGIIIWGGTMTLTNSVVSNNRSTFGGGGIFIRSFNEQTGNFTCGSMTLINSTVSGNTAFSGGGIEADCPTTLINSTVSDNLATGILTFDDAGGGGIRTAETLTLINVTVTRNRAARTNCPYCAGGIWNQNFAAATLKNTIVAGNTGGDASASPDFYGAVAAASSYNLIGNGLNMTGISNADANSNQVGSSASLIDPKLNPTLKLNGGTTPNHALLSGSPALDKGNSFTFTTDQRGTGFPRPVDFPDATYPNAAGGDGADIGAFEAQIQDLPNGSFDSADCSAISGWAWDPQQPNTPINVNIYADDNLVATVSANQFRQDLLDAGFGNGVHGFSFATPANLKDGQPHQIRVRIIAAPSDLNGSPKTITCATPPDLTITKTHTGNVTQGDTGKTYSITATNSGGTATSGLVSVTDALPNGLAATSINGSGWNCNFSNLTCTRSDALAGNTSYPAITLTVNVAGNAPPSVTNFASVSGGGETNTGNNLATDTTTISAAPVPTGIEGDVVSRPVGDNLILSNDTVQVQRFQIGLDRPFQSNEFQRADIAPANTRGNGVIDSADTTQAQRYEIGLDARQSVGGPTAPGGAAAAAADEWETTADLNGLEIGGADGGRRLRVETTFANAGQQVTVNLLADALGDESGYGFTLSYDTARLTNPSVFIGTAGGSRFCNTATAGEIRCSVTNFQMNNPNSSTDQIGEMAAGANLILARITFTALANASAGAAALTLTNVNASNDTAQSLAIGAMNGQVTIAGPTAASVSVSGRVSTGDGRGLTNATVTLTDASGGTRTARTGSFGYYRFKDVEAGQTYIFNVSSKRYSFAPQVVNVTEDLTELNFTARE